MTTLVHGLALWTVVAFSSAALIILLIWEWRRSDGSHLAARAVATILAIAGLALLGLHPAFTRSRPGDLAQTGVALWTSTDSRQPQPEKNRAGTLPASRFALPGAHATAPADATPIPDAASLRRRFPQIGTMQIFGDGLEPFELSALRGIRVVFDPPIESVRSPAITSIRCARVLSLGEPVEISGRVTGLSPGETFGVELGLAGDNTQLDKAPLDKAPPSKTPLDIAALEADRDGNAGFTVRAPAPAATGRFVWTLQLKDAPGVVRPADPLTIGVSVIAPNLPRVLILESSPRFDTTALRDWFERAGGALLARTLVGKDRYRFFTAGNDPPSAAANPPGNVPADFTAIDASLLARFDLVLSDTSALLALAPAEGAALQRAITEDGLGLLALADRSLLPPAIVPSEAAILLPWKLVPTGNPSETESAQRLVRVQWPGSARTSDTPVAAPPFDLAPDPRQSVIASDGQGRALAALVPRGNGRVALTLVEETGRWQRANDPQIFASYWSFLFSQVAKSWNPASANGSSRPGAWSVIGGDDAPAFVDEPVELVWNGASSGPPQPATVTERDSEHENGNEVVRLPLAQDPAETTRWHATVWPRQAGWHRVSSAVPAGEKPAALDFYVQPPAEAQAWKPWRAARRRAATARFAASSFSQADIASTEGKAGTETIPVPDAWFFAVFLLGVGYLWFERARAVSRASGSRIADA